MIEDVEYWKNKCNDQQEVIELKRKAEQQMLHANNRFVEGQRLLEATKMIRESREGERVMTRWCHLIA